MEYFDEVVRIVDVLEIADVALNDTEIAKIMAFLGAVADEGVGKRGFGVPVSVPSGLPLDAVSLPS